MAPEEYLEHAEECERPAGLARLEATKSALPASAAMWRKLAAEPQEGLTPEGSKGA